jgi:hypothetical protein
MNRILTCFAFLALPVFMFSQNFWEVSLTPGSMVYYGDLPVPYVTFKETHLGGQLAIKRYFHGEHAIRLGVLHGTISGNDADYASHSGRGNSFIGRLTEFSVMGEIDLRGRKRYTKKLGYQKTWSGYIMFGLSGIYCNPEVTYGEQNSKDLGIEYPNWHFGMPIGGGFKKDLNERLYIGAEAGLRLTLSDYLDGTQASGNAYKNDAFFFGGISAGYRFQKKRLNLPRVPTKA